MKFYLFPFERVKHDSHIILYGAGTVGQTYLRQILATMYCHVVCIIDQNYARYTSLPVEVCSIEKLPQKKYDVIVIANDAPSIAEEVCNMLMNQYHVPKEGIVYERKRIRPFFPLRDEENFVPDDKLSFSRKGYFPVAIKMSGGFGDYVIRKKNLQELAHWDSRLSIDLYVDQSKYEFAKVLFSDLPRIHAVIPAEMEYFAKRERYLAAMRFDPMLHVDVLNEQALGSVSHSLSEQLKAVQRSCDTYGLEDDGVLYSVHYARCEKDGINCYTSYNRYPGFHVTDYCTTIPMLDSWKNEFLSLNLGKYITLNYGWGKEMGSGRVSAKVWPLEHFAQLARLVKAAYSDLKIVQIGMRDAPEIDGCDHYVFGQDIELVKYVLKNSQLHVDCEGGMVHLATQLGTKCVVLFGPTPCKYYGYDVNINIVSEDCSNCYWLVPDFFSCYRGMEKPECMHSITPGIVMNKIQDYFMGKIQTL